MYVIQRDSFDCHIGIYEYEQLKRLTYHVVDS